MPPERRVISLDAIIHIKKKQALSFLCANGRTFIAEDKHVDPVGT